MTPVWGFADVIASRVAAVPVGDRLFGYLPPATQLLIKPVSITDQGLVDAAVHRANLPPGYNLYRRVNAEPGYKRARDHERMLLWPLYITSFCLWDALQDKDWYGAQQLVIVSASSKTSIGLAYALAADASAPKVLAVTSERNLDFVNRLGLYDRSVSYETLSAIDSDVPTAIVDMSGSARVLAALHAQLGDNMLHCVNVGLTHWDEAGKAAGIIRERSEFFFAPAHIQKRMKDWGPGGFAQRTSAFMRESTTRSRDWLKLIRIDGLDGLARIYGEVCAGRLSPDQGLMIEV
jgi:hypothetical protein